MSGPALVGLTGGIGSGKSTVARFLAARGVPIVDADELAREAVAPGSPGLEQVVARFGPEVRGTDGRLDRGALGRRVFADEAARRALGEILHPIVGELARARFAALAAAGATLVVYDVPLLFENGLQPMFVETLVVFADDATRIARLRARDGLDDDEIGRRMRAQMPLAEKVARADHVIDNSGTREATEAAAARWLEGFRARAAEGELTCRDTSS